MVAKVCDILANQFTLLKMSEIILTDRKPQMKRKEKHKMWKEVYLRVIHGISGIFFLSCWSLFFFLCLLIAIIAKIDSK